MLALVETHVQLKFALVQETDKKEANVGGGVEGNDVDDVDADDWVLEYINGVVAFPVVVVVVVDDAAASAADVNNNDDVVVFIVVKAKAFVGTIVWLCGKPSALLFIIAVAVLVSILFFAAMFR